MSKGQRTKVDREQLEADVVFVGAGPANLAAALHLSVLLQKHNQQVRDGDKPGPALEDLTIMVIEKAKTLGAHTLSGAVVDPKGFDELLKDFPEHSPPYDCEVWDDALYLLTSGRALRSRFTPPPLNNHGYHVASLGRLVRWMGELCEENGVEIYPEFPATELILEGQAVGGVRIGDKGRDSKGQPKPNFEPGIDLLAKVTVLGEGVHGTLARQAFQRLGLDRKSQHQLYAIGVKEIWEVPSGPAPGLVYHTLGHPLGLEDFGGGFIYTMENNLVDLGFVVGLDYRNPSLDCHQLLQRFKTHPFVAEMLQGGKPVSYGAKAIPEGGYYSMPELQGDGVLVVGDSAGFLNAQRLKGIHLAIKSGMMAAETILDALQTGDFSSKTLAGYQKRFEASWAHDELRKVRNFRQAFQKGVLPGIFHAALQFVSGGRGIRDPFPTQPGHARMEMLSKYFGNGERPDSVAFDGELTFDKLSDLFLSDTAHEEDQPCHLKILEPDLCSNRCTREYGNPCQHFCPAHVYEMVPEDGGRSQRLQINFTNCVHCKTCDIMDPYQVIRWTPPEGGGGPDWKNM